jgi:hypothetical protein
MIEKYLFQYEEKSSYPYRWILQRGSFVDTRKFTEKLTDFFPIGSFMTLRKGCTFNVRFISETNSFMFKLNFLDEYKYPDQILENTKNALGTIRNKK